MSYGRPISGTSVRCAAIYYRVWSPAVTPWIPQATRPDYRDKRNVMSATLEWGLGSGGWVGKNVKGRGKDSEERFLFFYFFFCSKFLEDISPFLGASDTPVLDFWWRLSWVSKPGWIPFACFLAYVILRFTSGATPADCIEVRMAAKPFQSVYLQTCPQALVEVWGSNPRPSVPHAASTAL